MPLASDYAALSELLLEIVAILMLFEQATFSTGFNLKLKSFNIFSFGLKFLQTLPGMCCCYCYLCKLHRSTGN